MSKKRVTLEMDNDLHEQLKQYAIRDMRTVNTVLRIFLKEFLTLKAATQLPNENLAEQNDEF